MTLSECAKDVGLTKQAVYKWIKKFKIPTKKTGLRDLYIDPEDWRKFCEEHKIVRREYFGQKG